MTSKGILHVTMCGNWGCSFEGFIVTTIEQVAQKTREFVQLKNIDWMEVAEVKFTPLVEEARNGVAIALGSKEHDIESVGIGFTDKEEDKQFFCPCLPGNREINVSLRSYAAQSYTDGDPKVKEGTVIDFISSDDLENRWYEVYHSGN